MFIINITYNVSLNTVDEYIEEHIVYLNKQYENENFIASGRKKPRTGGIILSKVNSKKELYEIIGKDPFYIANLANYEIIEFIPTLTLKQFDILKED